MAEKKVLVYQCDRCGNEHRRSTRGKQMAPKDWVEVLGRDICNVCVPDLEAWLVGQLPKRDDPVPLHMHMGVDPNAPAVHRVIRGGGPVDPAPSVWVSQNDDGERVVNVARPENNDGTTVVS